MSSEDITMHESATSYGKPGDKRKGKLPVGFSVSEEESRPPTSPHLPQRRRGSDLPPRGAARIKHGNETWHAEHPAMFPFGETVYSANYLSKQVLQNLDRGLDARPGKEEAEREEQERLNVSFESVFSLPEVPDWLWELTPEMRKAGWFEG